jgi:hypothetical protein
MILGGQAPRGLTAALATFCSACFRARRALSSACSLIAPLP